ncbi:nucleoside hydrolase [Pseudarthrobacter sp. S9]|uniref:nucleoside hydrolase n=1 Tax=Pseudarthrobacter sp. S9 TaxID=3418421 RepID=UPI003D029FFA
MSNDTAPIPIILDCDPGHDDAIAILLAVQSPRIDLLAVTTTFGNCSIDDATRNALRILTLAGATTTPVARGAAGSLAGMSELGNYVHGVSGLDGPEMPEPGFAPSEKSAVELMQGVLESSDHPVTIVATGPTTNVAALIQQHPEVVHKVAEIIFMGGSTERGNHTPTAEFNTYADPEALDTVINSGIPVRMVGLNLTHQALATPEIVARMQAMPHPIGHICGEWMGFFGSSYRAVWSFDSPPVHDPCTVAALIEPDLIAWQECFLAVETKGEWTRGTTIVDLHNRYERPPNASVAMKLDTARYWDLVLDAIDKLGQGR